MTRLAFFRKAIMVHHRTRMNQRRRIRTRRPIDLPSIQISSLLYIIGVLASVISPIMGTDKMSPQLMFQKMGETSYAENYVNIRIDYDLAHLLGLLNQMDRLVNKVQTEVMIYNSKDFLYDWEQESFTNASRCISFEIKDLQKRVQYLIDLQSPSSTKSQRREKKAVLWVFFAIAALAATIYGIYTSVELSRMKEEAALERRSLDLVADALESSNSRLNLTMSYLSRTMEEVLIMHKNRKAFMLSGYLQTTAQLLGRLVADAERIVQGAIHGYLDILAIDNGSFEKFMTLIDVTAENMGSIPIFQRRSDFLQCQTSFILEGPILTILVHVPVAPQNSFMEVYRLLDLVMPLNNDIFVKLETDKKYIAINHEDTFFKTFSALEMEQCTKFRPYISCRQSNIVRKVTSLPTGQDEDFCLLSVFFGWHKKMSLFCDFRVFKATEDVRQLDDESFSIFSSIAHQGKMTCAHNLSMSGVNSRINFHAYKYTIQKVPPGCVAQTDSFMFAAPQNGMIRGNLTISTPMIPTFLPEEDLQSKDKFEQFLEQAKKELISNNETSISLLKLRAELEKARQVEEELANLSWTNMFSSLFSSTRDFIQEAVIIFSMILHVITFTILCCRRR
jgi:hypothetical protein